MLTIRLTRIGKKNQPEYRLVLTDHTFPVKGKFIEILGSFDPRSEKVELKKERVEYWLKKGSKVSQTVKTLLQEQKVTGYLDVLNRKDRSETKKKGAEEAKPAEAAKAEAPVASEKKPEAKPEPKPEAKPEVKKEEKPEAKK